MRNPNLSKSMKKCQKVLKSTKKYRKVPKSTEKYRGTGYLAGSRRVHRHPYCRVFKLKKSKKRKIRIFEKPDFPVRIRIRWYGNIRGVTLRSQEVRRSQKKRKKIPEKPDFPDPDFRISAHHVEMGGPKTTCSQNFRPLAALEAEITRSKTIIIN